MFKYNCLNPIASVGLDLFSGDYEKVEDLGQADAALVRSAAMHELELPDSLLAVSRQTVCLLCAGDGTSVDARKPMCEKRCRNSFETFLCHHYRSEYGREKYLSAYHRSKLCTCLYRQSGVLRLARNLSCPAHNQLEDFGFAQR